MLATTLMAWTAGSFVISLMILLINMVLLWHAQASFASGFRAIVHFVIHIVCGIVCWLSGVVFLIGLVMWCVKHIN